MISTMATVKASVRKHGATIEENWDGDYCVDAPTGFVWACDGIHCLVMHWMTRDNGQEEWKGDKQIVIDDVLNRMTDGLTECEEVDCDVCGECS